MEYIVKVGECAVEKFNTERAAIKFGRAFCKDACRQQVHITEFAVELNGKTVRKQTANNSGNNWKEVK